MQILSKSLRMFAIFVYNITQRKQKNGIMYEKSKKM